MHREDAEAGRRAGRHAVEFQVMWPSHQKEKVGLPRLRAALNNCRPVGVGLPAARHRDRSAQSHSAPLPGHGRHGRKPVGRLGRRQCFHKPGLQEAAARELDGCLRSRLVATIGILWTQLQLGGSAREIERSSRSPCGALLLAAT